MRELEIDRIAADRIKNGPHEFIPFEDALTPEELTEFESQVEHKSAKTPLGEQGDVKEEGSVLWYATDD